MLAVSRMLLKNRFLGWSSTLHANRKIFSNASLHVGTKTHTYPATSLCRQRLLSTANNTSARPPKTPKVLPTCAAALIAAVSSLLGFYLSKEHSEWKAKRANTTAIPQFGSSQDFESAIAELRIALDLNAGEDVTEKVSTDPDELHTHGFSENDHFPGAYCLSFN
jgi:hypothetical protein